MPRQSRIDAPGALHHIIIRGIERRMIFRDDEDLESLLDRLGGILLESVTPCYSWLLLELMAISFSVQATILSPV